MQVAPRLRISLSIFLCPRPCGFAIPNRSLLEVRTLASTMTDLQIAATLNQAQLRSAKGKPFTNSMIHWIRYRYEIPAPVLKRPEEFTVKELARHFKIGIGVVHYWIQRGDIPTRRLTKTAPYWLTISPQKESELKVWVTSSSRIDSGWSQFPGTWTSGSPKFLEVVSARAVFFHPGRIRLSVSESFLPGGSGFIL